MKHLRPRFSIVVPCYNEERLIGRTLASLQAQDYSGNFEIIIVDNNCTDNTVTIAESYGVRIIHESRPGVCWARQAGTQAARGEIVVSTDADTVQSKHWLRTIDDTFKHDETLVAVCSPCRYSDGPWWGKQYPKLLFGAVNLVTPLIGRPFYITATNTAFKKSAWQGYHTELTQGGDELAILHDLKKQGKIVFNNNNPVYTSGRRLERGLVYNIFVTFLLYYLIAYYVNQLFNRTIIGNAPKFRAPALRRSLWSRVPKYAAIVIIVTVVHLPGHNTILQQSFETIGVVNHTTKSEHDISYRLAQKNSVALGPREQSRTNDKHPQ